MTITNPDTERGLYGKYRVERVDGKDKGPYFVLAYTSDPHARAALEAYADSCKSTHPQLAADLRALLNVDRCIGCGAYPDEPHPCVGT